MRSYLKNRKQRVRVSSSFTQWEAIFTFAPQGTTLGLFLFNIFLNDLLLNLTNSHLNNYADDNTLYCFRNNINSVSDKLRIDLAQIMEWFNKKYIVLNTNKYHYANMLWPLKPSDLSVSEGNITSGLITWILVPGMFCIFFHAKHAQNNAQTVIKVFDLDLIISNYFIKRNTVKQVSFHPHFEDDKRHGMSDWEITLIDQTDSVDNLRRRGVFSGNMNSTPSTKWTQWAWCDTLLMWCFT